MFRAVAIALDSSKDTPLVLIPYENIRIEDQHTCASVSLSIYLHLVIYCKFMCKLNHSLYFC